MPETNPLATGAAWMSGQVMPLSEARLPVNDWGLIHSDITYDVVPVWDGAFFRLADYLDRFESSMRALRMDVGMNGSQIRQALTDMVAASGLKEAYVAMVASRGVPLIPGTRDPLLPRHRTPRSARSQRVRGAGTCPRCDLCDL